ncbi:DUF6691 family protein [Baekduia sp. Peel2402]|uniref:DUF6691 family protein n=1 Tax=Baekduia sp. Peel2402 TaxID=3458296 RepID=UPI00403EDEDB
MAKVKGLLIGLVFGVTLSWAGMSSPNVIRDALLFHEGYLFFMFASAVATAALGQALLRRRAGERFTFPRERVERRHIVGSLLFGLGWGIANACPGPIATQIGQGIPWAIFPFAGMIGGVWWFLRAPRSVETEPARDATTTAAGGLGTVPA